MIVLRIKQCRDPLMWYAPLVGQTVPYLGTWPECYRSRDTGGFVNTVQFSDAEIEHDITDPTTKANP